MKKLQRLNKIYRLIKLQEQDVLAEFKQTQQVNTALKMQINDLTQHGKSSSDKLMHQAITINELNIVRTFNDKIELVLEQLNTKLSENEKNLMHVVDKIKDVRSRIKSIERLADRHQQIHDNELQKKIQHQIDENINYTLSSQD